MTGGLPKSVERRLDPLARYGLRLTIAAVALSLVAVPFSLLLVQVLSQGPVTDVDARIANAMNGAVHSHPLLIDMLIAISWLGKPPALWVVVGVAALHTQRHHLPRLTIFLLATSLGGALVSTVVKVAVDRPRPELEHRLITAIGKSFPSGHALSSTVVYGAVLVALLPMVHRRWRHAAVAATAVLVLAIGTTRVLLGVHFVSDVIAGHVLGVAWLLLAVATFETWRVERGRRPSEPLEEGIEPEAAAAL